MLNDPLSNQVNQEEVHNLLAGKSDDGTPKEEKNFVMHPDEHADLKQALGNASVEEPPKKPETKETFRADTPLPQQFKPDAEGLDEFLAWTFKSSSIPDVTVSDFEKTLFFKALLNDSDFELDIEFNLIEKFVVSIRGLTAFEQKVIASALKVDTDAQLIDGMHGFTSFMQQYCILYQVMRVNDKPFDCIETNKHPEWTFKEHVDNLRQKMRAIVDKMPSFKVLTLIKATIIFEIKQKLLHDGLVNRNFWKPQDIA